MSQLKRVVDQFGEVNVYPHASGKVRVVATILMEPHKEGTQTGIALDGSANSRHAPLISLPETTPVYVVPTDEELMIAQHTLSLLWSSRPSALPRERAS